MTPRLLPLLPTGQHGPHGSRSFVTCELRCANACFHPEPNPTDHGHIQDEITRALSRRRVLQGAAVAAGATMVGALAPQSLAAAATAPAAARGTLAGATFTPVAPNKRDAVVVPSGFRHDVLVSWGDPVVAGAPAFDVHHQTPEAAAQQFGYNCDYVGVIELADQPGKALLVVNNEYTNPSIMYPEGTYDAATQKQLDMAYHGMSVVTIKRGKVPGSWLRVSPAGAKQNRRITASTPFRMAGPAVGDPRLTTAADPSGTTVLGTLGNCAGGATPWGTVLSGEENFNGYFDKSGELDSRYTASYARYGLNGSGSRGWSEVDPRFDLTTEPHEPFRFGWIVEVDPLDPGSTPRKQTMLGRFKHEGANVAVAPNGKVVAYMGDDERGDYMYKFVSRDTFSPGPSAKARRKNLKLLTAGTLYVAKFTGDGTEDGQYDGTGEWIPLTSDTESFVDGMSVQDVLIDTRLAADKVGPTKMDRPEDVEPNPVNGKVYAALTNNSNRGSSYPADEANPLTTSHTRPALGAALVEQSGNRNGYVLEITPDRNHTTRTFTWDLMLVCGDPEAQETYFAGYDKTKVSPISCPDNVTFDSTGNLWVATDGNVLGSNDGLFRVPVAGPERGHVQQFLTVPREAETCGPLVFDGDRSLFFSVQHPGENGSFAAQNSTWPHTDDFPRPSVCVAYKAR